MKREPMHLQLDPLGGCAGDMFVAAILDAFPEHEAALVAAVEAAAPVRCRLVAHNDGVLQGRRFLVEPLGGAGGEEHGHHHGHEHHHHHHHGHEHHGHGHHHHDADHQNAPEAQARHGSHGHRRWSLIRADLAASALAPAVREGAIAIFTHLARAEAKVHGIDPELVEFHEVGAWDSIADIVAAAFLLDALGAGGRAPSVAVAALPMGSGRVMTAHGPLPVPAPATALLLEGFATLDDGIPGERVTPTGAAARGWKRTKGERT